MKGRTRDDGTVIVDGDARQRFHDNRGYGEPRDGTLALSRVEAAHLLERGDLDTVDGDGAAVVLHRFAADDTSFLPGYTVYADLRERGFYPGHDPDEGRIPLPPQGTVPAAADAADLHSIDPRPERASVAASTLGDGTVAAVDDEGDVTYLRTTSWDATGDATGLSEAVPDAVAAVEDGLPATACGDHTLLDAGAAADALHDGLHLGAPTPSGLRLAPPESVYVDDHVGLDADLAALASDPVEDVVYADLRARGFVPRTGFKFGGDLHAYERPAPGEDHSTILVRTRHPADDVPVRELARLVRLATGVRKQLVLGFADPDAGELPRYVAVDRERP